MTLSHCDYTRKDKVKISDTKCLKADSMHTVSKRLSSSIYSSFYAILINSQKVIWKKCLVGKKSVITLALGHWVTGSTGTATTTPILSEGRIAKQRRCSVPLFRLKPLCGAHNGGMKGRWRCYSAISPKPFT